MADEVRDRRGGKRPGAGRPWTAEGIRRLELKAALAEARTKPAERLETGDGPFAGNAVALLTWIYKNPKLPAQIRFEAAKAVAPYEMPRLSSIKHEIRPLQDMSDDELASLLSATRALLAGQDTDRPGTVDPGRASKTRH
jgi:hypothetical protein